MANDETLARPYAKAAFAFALEHQQIPLWKGELAQLARVVGVPEMADLLRNPLAGIAQTIEIIKDCVTSLSEPVQNFLQTLAEYRRLRLLPAILVLFDAYSAEAEQTMNVHVTSALPFTEAQREQFIQVLHKKFQRNINMICATDPGLMAGAVIRANDSVMDGSVRNRLKQLTDHLKG